MGSPRHSRRRADQAMGPPELLASDSNRRRMFSAPASRERCRASHSAPRRAGWNQRRRFFLRGGGGGAFATRSSVSVGFGGGGGVWFSPPSSALVHTLVVRV